jgi:hypothetical protein
MLADSLNYQVRVEEAYTVRAGLQALYCDDVVVYDLSGNDDRNGPYRALAGTYRFCDHALLVSKDYLPSNVFPHRVGGAPPYPYPLDRLPDGTELMAPAFDLYGEILGPWIAEEDHSLLSWLRRQLTDLASKPVGERLSRAGSHQVAWSLQSATRRHVSKLVYGSIPVPQGAFLSYRGFHFDAAMELARQVADSGLPGTSEHRLRVISPSEFALDRELMSAGRRWMVLAWLWELIRAAEEFWIYRTADYERSWWTRGELVCWAIWDRRATKGRISSAPTLRAFDPTTGLLAAAPNDLQISLRSREASRIGDILDTVNPGDGAMNAWAQLSKRGRPPKGVSHVRTWDDFWTRLLIDRSTITGQISQPVSGHGLIDAIGDMASVDPAAAAAAIASDGRVRADDGTAWRLAELPPRLLYDTPKATRLDIPVLSRSRTYYVLE